jgi:hypothetical protein
VRLVYDHRKLLGVTTARLGVVGVLQSEFKHFCDRNTLKMRGLSPKIISGDS